ncbi:DUF4440 domain-containing protein [Primorskyibacter sp. S187A]|uniref:DUF4440 domain-containing protein n=1 Tax=Primorskyibacter sp. S187A TaxID=3415130 RepID=UPI003C7DBBCF
MAQEDASLLAEIKACETRVWDALVRGDAQADAAALHPDFIGIYETGFAGKADHVGQLSHGPTLARFSLDACQIRRLGPQHVVFMYRATFQRIGRDTSETMYVSSIWERDGSGWINLVSQDTPATG